MREVSLKVSDGDFKSIDYTTKNREKMIEEAKKIGFKIENEVPDIINFEKKEIYYRFGKNKLVNSKKYLNVVDELKLNGFINHDINIPIFNITSLSFLSAAYSLISYDGEIVSLYIYSEALNNKRLEQIRELTNCTKKALTENLLDKVYVLGIDYNLKERKIENKLRLYFTANEEKYRLYSKSLEKDELHEIESKLSVSVEGVKKKFKIEKNLDALALIVEDGNIKHYNYYF